jgi:hypothetical protein
MITEVVYFVGKTDENGKCEEPCFNLKACTVGHFVCASCLNKAAIEAKEYDYIFFYLFKTKFFI